MCAPGDLLVLVVEPNELELKETCLTLNNLGIIKQICVTSYEEAAATLTDAAQEIDIVIADFEIQTGRALGLLLCENYRRHNPGMTFILLSKQYSCSVAIQSLQSGAVDDLLDKSRSGEVEILMKKWVALAQQRIKTKEILNDTVL